MIGFLVGDKVGDLIGVFVQAVLNRIAAGDEGALERAAAELQDDRLRLRVLEVIRDIQTARARAEFAK